jgi:hypothetical protein
MCKLCSTIPPCGMYSEVTYKCLCDISESRALINVYSAWVRAGLPSPTRPGFRDFVSSPGPSVSDGRPYLELIDGTNYKPIRPSILKKPSCEPNDYQNIIPQSDTDLHYNYEAELENEKPQIPESGIAPLIDLDFDPSLVDPQLSDDIDSISGIQRPIGGILTSISSSSGISVPPSRLNTELFYFCKYPNLALSKSTNTFRSSSSSRCPFYVFTYSSRPRHATRISRTSCALDNRMSHHAPISSFHSFGISSPHLRD